MAHGLVDQRDALADHLAVPATAILIVEQDDRAVGVEPRRGARLLQQHQRGQAHDLRLGGEEPQQQAAEPDRLLAQSAARLGRLRAGGIALVEHQINHRQHGADPLRPLHRAGSLEGHLGLGDARLGPGNSLFHGRLADQKGAGDLADAQARDDPQRQRDLLRRRQLRVATDEHQPQDVVSVVRPVQPVGHRSLHVVDVGDLILRRKRGLSAGLAHPVQRRVAADQDQPCGRIARRPLGRPGPQRPQAGLLIGLLGGVEVAEIAQQGADRLGTGRGQGGVDPGKVTHWAAVSAENPPGRNKRKGRIS